MMSKRPFSFFAILLLAAAAGCSTTSQADRDKQAIRAALQKYLSERSNLNVAAMDMEVKEVSLSGNRADAQVEFRAKQGGVGMQMTYALERQGELWVVRSGRPSGGNVPHPATGGAMPPAGEMPAGHPPLGEPGKAPAQTGAGAMPADHPPVGQPGKTSPLAKKP